jgi:hypothetical protein
VQFGFLLVNYNTRRSASLHENTFSMSQNRNCMIQTLEVGIEVVKLKYKVHFAKQYYLPYACYREKR